MYKTVQVKIYNINYTFNFRGLRQRATEESIYSLFTSNKRGTVPNQSHDGRR